MRCVAIPNLPRERGVVVEEEEDETTLPSEGRDDGQWHVLFLHACPVEDGAFTVGRR